MKVDGIQGSKSPAVDMVYTNYLQELGEDEIYACGIIKRHVEESELLIVKNNRS